MKFKVVVTLHYNGFPIDGDVFIFVDGSYITTLHVINGYAETIIDVEGYFIEAFYPGSFDFEEAYVRKKLPIVKPPTPIGLIIALSMLGRDIYKAFLDSYREKIGLPETTYEELEEIVRDEDEYYGY